MWLLFGFMACQDKSLSNDSADTMGKEGFTPAIPTASCGQNVYDWVSTKEMGTLLEVEDVDELSLSKDTLNLLLEQLGVGDLAPVSYDVVTYRVRYLTQDRGKQIEATGLVTLPVGATTPVPPLLWTHPTTGFTDECAPSAQGLEGAAFPILWAALGFAVAAPDYIGMAGWGTPSNRIHPYVVAEATAIASLDSLRAMEGVIETRENELQIDHNKSVFWGVSEGGYAALVSERYRPHYLPEFETVATVAAIPATDLTALAKLSLAELHDSTFGLLAVMKTHADWYGNSVSLDDAVLPEIATEVDSLIQQCEDFGVSDGITTVEQVFLPEFIEAVASEDWQSIEPWSCYFQENSFAQSLIPSINPSPTLIITAEFDDLALPDPVHNDIELLCGQGYTIEHRQCAGADHVDGAVDTLEDQILWINQRLSNLPLDSTCIVQDPSPCD